MSIEPASLDLDGSSTIAPSLGPDAASFATEIKQQKQHVLASARDAAAGQRYAFNDQPSMPGSGTKTDAAPQVPGPSFWSGLKGISLLGAGYLAADLAADTTARNSISTNYYAPDLALRVYRDGSPGPNGEKAAFLRTSPDGKEEILPVDVKLNEDAWRHLGQPLREIVSFDQNQLGQAYDLSRLTPENRQRLGLRHSQRTPARTQIKRRINPLQTNQRKGGPSRSAIRKRRISLPGCRLRAKIQIKSMKP